MTSFKLVSDGEELVFRDWNWGFVPEDGPIAEMGSKVAMEVVKVIAAEFAKDCAVYLQLVPSYNIVRPHFLVQMCIENPSISFAMPLDKLDVVYPDDVHERATEISEHERKGYVEALDHSIVWFEAGLSKLRKERAAIVKLIDAAEAGVTEPVIGGQ